MELKGNYFPRTGPVEKIKIQGAKDPVQRGNFDGVTSPSLASPRPRVKRRGPLNESNPEVLLKIDCEISDRGLQ